MRDGKDVRLRSEGQAHSEEAMHDGKDVLCGHSQGEWDSIVDVHEARSSLAHMRARGDSEQRAP